MSAIETFNEKNFHVLCRRLARLDPDLAGIIREHGYPPMWTRPATFQTLYRTIASMMLWHAYIKKRRIQILG